jgi:voltage-gated potassium channel
MVCSLNLLSAPFLLIETHPVSGAGKWVTVPMIVSGIILIPWQVSRIVKEWICIATKKRRFARGCGIRCHDEKALHCKSCAHIIYQDYDEN